MGDLDEDFDDSDLPIIADWHDLGAVSDESPARVHDDFARLGWPRLNCPGPIGLCAQKDFPVALSLPTDTFACGGDHCVSRDPPSTDCRESEHPAN